MTKYIYKVRLTDGSTLHFTAESIIDVSNQFDKLKQDKPVFAKSQIYQVTRQAAIAT